MQSLFGRPHWSLDQLELGQSPLYEGKASKVFRATDKLLGADVAVKWYIKANLSPLNRRQIDREVHIHSQIQHENVIRLFASFESDEHLYMVEEFAAGGDLFIQAKTSPHSRFGEEQAQQVMMPFLCGLRHLHDQGILHRDIKPENVVFSAEGVVKIIDFGLAINLHEERPVTRLGTLDYMAPEVLSCPDKLCPLVNKEREDLEYSCQVDTWATGVLVYELLVGRPPFEQATRLETYSCIVNHDADNMELPDLLSPLAKDFIRVALQQDPARRATAAQLMCHPWLQKVAAPMPAPGQRRARVSFADCPSSSPDADDSSLPGWPALVAPGTAPAGPRMGRAGACTTSSSPFLTLQAPGGMSSVQGSHNPAPLDVRISDDSFVGYDSGSELSNEPDDHRPYLNDHALVADARPCTRAGAVNRGRARPDTCVGGAVARPLSDLRGCRSVRSHTELTQLWPEARNNPICPSEGDGHASKQFVALPSSPRDKSIGGSSLQRFPSSGMTAVSAARSASLPLCHPALVPVGLSIPTQRPPARGGHGSVASKNDGHGFAAWPPQIPERPARRSGPGNGLMPFERPVQTAREPSGRHSCSGTLSARRGFGKQLTPPALDLWANDIDGQLQVVGTIPGGSELHASSSSPALAMAPPPGPPPSHRHFRKQASADYDASPYVRATGAGALQQRIVPTPRQGVLSSDVGLGMPLSLAGPLGLQQRQHEALGELSPIPTRQLEVQGANVAHSSNLIGAASKWLKSSASPGAHRNISSGKRLPQHAVGLSEAGFGPDIPRQALAPNTRETRDDSVPAHLPVQAPSPPLAPSGKRRDSVTRQTTASKHLLTPSPHSALPQLRGIQGHHSSQAVVVSGINSPTQASPPSTEESAPAIYQRAQESMPRTNAALRPQGPR